MENDEKSTSHDDETPPTIEAEENMDGDRDGLFAAPGPKPGARAADAVKADAGLEANFGMPEFGFADNMGQPVRDHASGDGDEPARDGLKAAMASLKTPLNEDTGWRNADSIERPFPNGGFPSDADEGEDFPSFMRSEAKVMPFPGSAIPRHAEPAPSELLRADSRGDEGKVLAADDDNETADPPLYDKEPQDALAEAVQSALRNVYGGLAREEAAPDFENYTVAESLRLSSQQDRGWSDQGADWRNDGQDDYFAAEPEPHERETSTDAVLDYLYGQRRAGRRESTVLSADASLRDFGESSAYARDWQDRDFDDRAGGSGLRDFGGPPYRAGSPVYADAPDQPFSRDVGGYRSDIASEVEWDDQPYASAPTLGQGSTYPVHVASSTPESLAASSPDSSHLLGAAGLGLIGGIALAGILAVFVFNSFVDDTETAVAEVTPKVVERLDSAPAEPKPAAATVAEPEALQRSAALPAESQPAPAVPATPPRQPEAEAADALLSAANVYGSPSQPIALDIKLADTANQDESLVSIKGLPSEARLSTGIDVGGGQWLLPPSRLRDLTVTLPSGTSGSYKLEVQLLKDDAQTSLTEPVSFTLTAGPQPTRSAGAVSGDISASANAEQAARLAVLPDETPQIETDLLTQMLIRDGNKLMREGDIAGARRLYEQASTNGNPEAALAMGRSYDPSYFEKLPVKTGKPDPAVAFEWYKKALDGGLVTARVKIDGLKQWLQR